MMSLPPRAANAFRLGFVALRLDACCSSAIFTPLSKLKVLKSHAGSSKTMLGKKPVVKRYIRAVLGVCPVIQVGQPPAPSSAPITRPGKIFWPLDVLGPE